MLLYALAVGPSIVSEVALSPWFIKCYRFSDIRWSDSGNAFHQSQCLHGYTPTHGYEAYKPQRYSCTATYSETDETHSRTWRCVWLVVYLLYVVARLRRTPKSKKAYNRCGVGRISWLVLYWHYPRSSINLSIWLSTTISHFERSSILIELSSNLSHSRIINTYVQHEHEHDRRDSQWRLFCQWHSYAFHRTISFTWWQDSAGQ